MSNIYLSQLPPWLVDTGVITTLITACSAFLGTLITTLASRKDKLTRRQYEQISESLGNIQEQLLLVDNTMSDVKETTELTKDGTVRIQGYRLSEDLAKWINHGSVPVAKHRELTTLYNSYKRLGGNGTVEAFYHKFEQLPIEIPKEE